MCFDPPVICMHGTVLNWCFWDMHYFELMLQKDAILQWNDTLIHEMVCLFKKDAIFWWTDMIFQKRSHPLSEPLPLFRRGIWRLYKPAFIHRFRHKFSKLQTLFLSSKHFVWSIKLLSEFVESNNLRYRYYSDWRSFYPGRKIP